MPKIENQPIKISLVDGVIKVDPKERDLYENEQIQWICKEPLWEAVFNQAGVNSPFSDDTYGPGLTPPDETPQPQRRLIDDGIPIEETPGEVTGTTEGDAPDGEYNYTVTIPGTQPVMARVRIKQQPRPI